MNDDIFSNDKKFSEEQKKEESIGKGFGQIGKGLLHMLSGIKHILIKTFKINLIILIILLLAVFFSTKFFISAPECPNITCPECKCPEINITECPKQECPVFNVTEPVIKNIFYYVCPNGAIVNKSEECARLPINLTSKDYSERNNIILSIDSIEYNLEQNDSARITKINYTIMNLGEKQIMPKIDIKVYERWSNEIAEELPAKTIHIDKLMGYNAAVIRSDKVNIYFRGLTKYLRLELFDILPDPDESLVAISKQYNFSS